MDDKQDLNKNLLIAAKHKYLLKVEEYLDLGADVNCTDVDTGETALHIACRSNNNVGVVQVLLQRGCNPNRVNKEDETALHLACSLTNVEILVQFFLGWGCNPQHKDKQWRTALHVAANNRLATSYCIRLLLKRGCRPNQKDIKGRTSLHYAAKNGWGKTDCIRLLLDGGCCPDQKDKEGKTALIYAAEFDSPEIFKLFIEYGSKPDQTDNSGKTALHYAAQCPSTEIVYILLEYGCKIDQTDKSGKTALHYAAKCPSTDIVTKLLMYGFKPDQTDKSGRTALHYAAEKTAYSKIITTLLDHGCKPNQKDNEGRTVLHVAASQASVESDFIRILLESGCSPVEKDRKGENPLELFEHIVNRSRERDRTITRKLLLEYTEYWQMGLPIEIKDFDEKSANIFASLLQEKGYEHYEARVMLAGEPGTGKTTIARYLVGKGSTKIRISTDGIDLYNGLSFIDRVTEEWMPGKQGFTLSEISISRSLRLSEEEVITSSLQKMGGTSTGFEFDSWLTERKVRSSDRLTYQDLSSENLLSSTTDSAHCIPNLSLKETILVNNEDPIDRIEVVNNALLAHEQISKDEVFDILSDDDPGLVQDKYLKNKYSISSSDIGKADVCIKKQPKTKATKETFPVIPRKAAEEMHVGGKKVATPLLDRLETIPNSSDEHIVSLNESTDYAREKEQFYRIDRNSKPHSTTTEVIKDRTIIGKLKKLLGVQKDVTEIKVSMTKDRFLKESMKVGKKKLHQKKIAPVIIWDFGGQDVFYSTHQTFLTYRAIYLIVLDGSRTLDDPCPFEQYLPGKSGRKTARDYLRFWINTIVTYCKASGPGFPKIMIVLTHKDKLDAVEVEPKRKQIFHEIEKMFSGSSMLSHLVIKEQLFVNARNKRDPEMAKIKKVITEQAMTQPTWGQNLPKCFIPLEWEFDSLLSRNIPLITMEQMERINYLQPVRRLTEEELKVFLKFQHSVGRILYFDIAHLDQHIILSPTHLIDAFKSIVTARRFCKGDRMRQASWDLMSKKGIMEKKSIEDIWKKQKYKKFQDHKEHLLGVMTHLDILVEPKRYDKTQKRIPADFFYVASMVRTNDTTGYLMSPTFSQRNIALAFSSSSSMIPPALSFRFISYCLSIFAVKNYGQNDDEMLFHRSAVFKIDQSLDMCVNCDDEIIVVRLVHSRNRTLITRDLATSIGECLAVALEKISQLYVKTSSTDKVTSKRSFNISLCCSSPDDHCFLPLSALQKQDGSWICPKHGIEHTKDMMTSWAIQKDEIQCGIACPVTDTEFLEQIPSDIHLRRLSMQYSINETKELAMHLGMDYQTWDDLHETFGEEPERLKFEALQRPVEGNHLSFNDIRKAVEFGEIRTQHSLCKVVRSNQIDFDLDPEKWDLVPTEEHLDRLAPLVGNSSLSFLVELGMEFQTWIQIKYRQAERDLVKLNRDILQEWKSEFCSINNIRPCLRDIAKAFNNINKNVKVIENVLEDLF